MLHPSYVDLMKVVNKDVIEGEAPVINSRYSIVMATAKRARQIVDGEEPLLDESGKKPLSVAVDELNEGLIRILSEDEVPDEEELLSFNEGEMSELEEASEIAESEETAAEETSEETSEEEAKASDEVE